MNIGIPSHRLYLCFLGLGVSPPSDDRIIEAISSSSLLSLMFKVFLSRLSETL